MPGALQSNQGLQALEAEFDAPSQAVERKNVGTGIKDGGHSAGLQIGTIGNADLAWN